MARIGSALLAVAAFIIAFGQSAGAADLAVKAPVRKAPPTDGRA
jgi:hypothetical protein